MNARALTKIRWPPEERSAAAARFCPSNILLFVFVTLVEMHVQIAPLGERLRAEVTFVGPLPSVGIDVQSEVEALRESFAAVRAAMLLGWQRTGWRFRQAVLTLQMDHHLVHRSERSVTSIALERSQRIMRCLHVIVEIALLGKRAIAQIARVRFVAGVSVYVRLQVAGLAEILLAVGTFPVLLVLDVHDQSFQVNVRRWCESVVFLICLTALVQE